ncbi:MAG: succinate dehydrogenase, partial [Anaerolineae bacterium]
DRFEINIWLFMRISGALLIILALLHMFILHFVISVEAITFQTVVDRWADAATGWFWRSYDLLLLIMAFTHGILGLRYVIQDYFHGKSSRGFLLFGAGALWVVLILMGAYIIFFFNGAA